MINKFLILKIFTIMNMKILKLIDRTVILNLNNHHLEQKIWNNNIFRQMIYKSNSKIK